MRVAVVYVREDYTDRLVREPESPPTYGVEESYGGMKEGAYAHKVSYARVECVRGQERTQPWRRLWSDRSSTVGKYLLEWGRYLLESGNGHVEEGATQVTTCRPGLTERIDAPAKWKTDIKLEGRLKTQDRRLYDI
jgi:hypothetical protein